MNGDTKKGSGIRDQGSESIKQILRDVLPPVDDATDLPRDLWPSMLERLKAPAKAPPWYDWALAGGLIMFAAFAPASIPVLLYYL